MKVNLIAIIAVLGISVGQILMKIFAFRLNGFSFSMDFLLSSWKPLGIILFYLTLTYGASIALWLFVIQRLELNKAFMFAGLTFVFVPALSSIFLNEHLSFGVIAGSLLIVLGITISVIF